MATTVAMAMATAMLCSTFHSTLLLHGTLFTTVKEDLSLAAKLYEFAKSKMYAHRAHTSEYVCCICVNVQRKRSMNERYNCRFS